MTRHGFRKGFTLAELLIVIAIVGVLVAIAIPVFTTNLDSARDATCQANRRSAQAMIATAAMTNADFHAARQDGESWSSVSAALVTAGYSFPDKICPSDGTIKLVKGNYSLSLHCGIHGATDFDNALSMTDGLDQTLGDYDYVRAYVKAAEEKGGLITIPKKDFLNQYYPDGPSDIHHKINDSDPIVWSGMRIRWNGQWCDALVATRKSNVKNNGNPLLNGYVVYYNGSYYRSTKQVNGRIDENSLRPSSGSFSSYEEMLQANHWEKV